MDAMSYTTYWLPIKEMVSTKRKAQWGWELGVMDSGGCWDPITNDVIYVYIYIYIYISENLLIINNY